MNWTRRRLLASAAGVCSITGCLGSASNDGRSLPNDPAGTWQQSGHDPRNTCATDVGVPDRGTPAWSAGSGLLTPVVVDGTVYTADDVLTALDAQTGEREWQTDLGIEPSPNSATQPAVVGEQVLLASEGRIASFDTADGSTRWERTTEGMPNQPTTVAADRHLGLAFFERPEERPSPSELVAFATGSGETEWTVPLRGLAAPPAVFGGRVYVVGWSGPETQVLRCLEATDGTRVWEHETDDAATPPVGTETGVLVGDGEELLAYDHSDGEHLSSIGVQHGRIRAIAVDDGMAFVLAESGLSAVSVPDGDIRWSRSGEEGYAQGDGLAVGRETVVAPVFPESVDASPSVAAFDKTDGTPMWYYAIDDGWSPTIASPPVLADGAVFTMSNTRTGVTALGDLPPRTEATRSS